MLIDIVQLGNLFNFKSFLIVLILKLCFCKRHHHIKGHKTCVGMFILQADKFLKCDWLRLVIFKPNSRYLHVKITPVT